MKRTLLQSVALYLTVLVLIIFTLAPLLWLLIMSLCSANDLTTIPLHWLPSHADWSRYGQLLDFKVNIGHNPFLQALKNSLIAAGGATLLALAAAIPAAYAFSRKNAPSALLFVMLATVMIPPVTYILPLYSTLSNMNMLNNPLTLIIIYCSMLLPFATWLMKSNIDILPVEIEQAATVEGATTLQTLFAVVLPMAKPAIIATAMLSFLLAWDEFFYSLIFNSDWRGKTLPVAIADFAAGKVTDYGLIASVGVLASLPPVLVSLLFQKHLVRGLASGGVKG